MGRRFLRHKIAAYGLRTTSAEEHPFAFTKAATSAHASRPSCARTRLCLLSPFPRQAGGENRYRRSYGQRKEHLDASALPDGRLRRWIGGHRWSGHQGYRPSRPKVEANHYSSGTRVSGREGTREGFVWLLDVFRRDRLREGIV